MIRSSKNVVEERVVRRLDAARDAKRVRLDVSIRNVAEDALTAPLAHLEGVSHRKDYARHAADTALAVAISEMGRVEAASYFAKLAGDAFGRKGR